jgi:hypothetical protein
MFSAVPANADRVFVDYQDPANPGAMVLNFGAVCVGSSVTKTARVSIVRTGVAAEFADNSSVRLTMDAAPEVSTSEGIRTAPELDAEFVVPPNWSTLGPSTDNNFAEVLVPITVKLLSTESGNFGPGLIYKAVGVSSTGATIVTDTTLVIISHGVDCDGTGPVLTLPPPQSLVATGPSGAVATYSASAEDEVDGSVPVVCDKPSGATFSVGVTEVNCSAEDSSGNTSEGSFFTTVGYGFAGYFQPINDPAGSNQSDFKKSSTVPVKFALTYANDSRIADPEAGLIASACNATLSLTRSAGTPGSVDEPALSTPADTTGCFRYEATSDQFIYNLSTKALSVAVYSLKTTVTSVGSVVGVHEVKLGVR